MTTNFDLYLINAQIYNLVTIGSERKNKLPPKETPATVSVVEPCNEARKSKAIVRDTRRNNRQLMKKIICNAS